MQLFKYLSSSRVDVLRSKMIVFSSPTNFNDPFDCMPHYTESAELNPAGASVYFLADGLDFNAPGIRSEVIGHVTRSKEADPSYALQAFMPIGSMIAPENYGAFACGFRASFARRMHDSVVALSLSEEPNSLLMWAHYAEQHAGFVMGFSASHPYFNSAEGNSYGPGYLNPGCLNKVEYSDERPSGVVLSMNVEKTHLTKGLEWSYEKEWRILQVKDNSSFVKEDPSGNRHLFEYPSDAVTQIVIGARATQETKEAIKSIVGDRVAWPNVSLYQAVIDPQFYRLNYEPISL